MYRRAHDKYVHYGVNSNEWGSLLCYVVSKLSEREALLAANRVDHTGGYPALRVNLCARSVSVKR